MRKAINGFSRVLGALVLCVGLVVTSCAKNNDALEEHGNRLENLEGVQIKNLKEQVSSINVSLKDLQTVDANLQKLIDDLEAEATDLETQLDANSAADVATKKALEDEIANIKTLIEALLSKDAELDQKIADLKTYVDSELKSTEDWANATFATLSQYAAVQTEISAIKALLEQSGTDIEADLSAIQKAIEDAIAASETSMKGWVNATLAEGYYDIAAIDGKIAALNTAITEGDDALAADIAELTSKLDQAKADLTTAYQTAIETAINDNNGVIRGEIADAITEAQDALQLQITSITSEITTIKEELNSIKNKLDELLSRIQSVVYMPEYSDGVTYVDATEKTAEMSFKISPSSVVTALEDVWSQALSVKYMTTILKKSTPELSDLKITSAEFDENLGIVTLLVDCKNLNLSFFEGTTTACVSLYISDGSNKITSEFIEILPTYDLGDELSYTDDISSLYLVTTATSATISGTVLNPTLGFEMGILYSQSPDFTTSSATKMSVMEFGADKGFSITIPSLAVGNEYYYCLYSSRNGLYKYGDIKTFRTIDIIPQASVIESTIDKSSASFNGTVSGLSDRDRPLIEIGIAYSNVGSDFLNNDNIKKPVTAIAEDNTFSISIENLYYASRYYYCAYYKQGDTYTYGSVKDFETTSPITAIVPSDATDLSASGSANCYIVSERGKYCFKIVQGNSSNFVGAGLGIPEGTPSYANVLWESYGSDITPSEGDLIKNVSYKDGYISFETADNFAKGNAVIAIRDASGKILWSWHIWLTDEPEEQVYYNNAGTMMDRNLGATSATPGDVGALGLFYQWGRKDPFLGSSSIDVAEVAKSTVAWPAHVSSTESTGTTTFAIENPTTYIEGRYNDWEYILDITKWQSDKTIFDPCPAGWRVPDGVESSIWAKALGTYSPVETTSFYDSTNKGLNLTGKLGDSPSIWYPFPGVFYSYDGTSTMIDHLGLFGGYFTTTYSKFGSNDSLGISVVFFDASLIMQSAEGGGGGTCCSVRCMKETN